METAMKQPLSCILITLKDIKDIKRLASKFGMETANIKNKLKQQTNKNPQQIRSLVLRFVLVDTTLQCLS